jgi:hypothetical protein
VFLQRKQQGGFAKFQGFKVQTCLTAGGWRDPRFYTVGGFKWDMLATCTVYL